MVTLASSRRFRLGVLAAALAVAALEAGVFVVLWRVGTLADPGGDPRAAAAFIALGTALTLQAMAVVGVVWAMVAMAWTTLGADAVGWTLDHPWRSWQGTPREVARAWRHGGWLVLELDGHWRRWYVRAGRDADAAVADLRGQLPGGAWLEGAAVRAHLMRHVLPVVLAAAGVGGLVLLWGMRALDRLMHAE